MRNGLHLNDTLFTAFLDAVFAPPKEQQNPKISDIEYDDDSGELHVSWRYPDGHTEIGVYIEKSSIIPVRTTRKPRKCTLNTPVDACEDRDCFHHRNHSAAERPRI